jgi:hypothetical protein
LAAAICLAFPIPEAYLRPSSPDETFARTQTLSCAGSLVTSLFERRFILWTVPVVILINRVV